MTRMMNGCQEWKAALQRIYVRSPYFRVRHHFAHRDKLTVIAFHRVIAESDRLFPESNPQWTMTPGQFQQALQCIRRYFTIVSPRQVRDFFLADVQAPASPLLITFDDGWADNYKYAFPILKSCGCSAVFFISTDAIGSHQYFWQEALFSYFRNGSHATELQRMLLDGLCAEDLVARMPIVERRLKHLISAIGALPPLERRAYLERHRTIIRRQMTERMFMDESELKELSRSGNELGSHGKSHDPLASSTSLLSELHDSKNVLESITGMRVSSLSYPHGSRSAETDAMCRQAGYELLYTSRNGLNCLESKDHYAIRRMFLPSWRMTRSADTEHCDSVLMDL